MFTKNCAYLFSVVPKLPVRDQRSLPLPRRACKDARYQMYAPSAVLLPCSTLIARSNHFNIAIMRMLFGLHLHCEKFPANYYFLVSLCAQLRSSRTIQYKLLTPLIIILFYLDAILSATITAQHSHR